MRSDDDPVAPEVRRRFLELYVNDRRAGRSRPLEEYQARFPGHADLVAAEFARVRDPASEAPPMLEDRGASFGSYRLVRELGRGGHGVVYLADDTRLQRQVALKVLNAFGAQSSELRMRLRREAAAASRLDHPGICSVHEIGEADGMPFIAMRYVAGRSLADVIARAKSSGADVDEGRYIDVGRASTGPMSPTTPSGPTTRGAIFEILAMIESVGRALHVAHEAGLVHRDIKPGNIMVPDEGAPVILDFGIARAEADDHSLTQTGQLMGTPAYMAPEQIAAQRISVDRRADVYSLGVTLFECLTLRQPFEAPTREQLYHRIMVEAAPDPRRLNPKVPKDLKAVLEVALDKNRDRRYQTALALAEDLRRIREMQPIVAKPPGRVVRAQRWVARNRVVSALSALSLMLAVASTIGFVLEASARRDAQTAQHDAERHRDRAVALADESIVRQASDRLRADPTGAVALLKGLSGDTRLASTAACIAADAMRRGVAARRADLPFRIAAPDALGFAEAGWRLEGNTFSVDVDPKSPAQLLLNPPSPDPIVLSPNRERIALASGDGLFVANCAADGGARLTGHSAAIRDLAWAPDSRMLASASDDRSVRVWTVHSGSSVALEHDAPVRGVAWAPDAERVVAAAGSKLHLWHLGDRRSRVLFNGRTVVSAVAWSRQGYLAWSDADGVHLLTRIDGTRRFASLQVSVDGDVTKYAGLVRNLVWSPDGTRLAIQATAFLLSDLWVWDVRDPDGEPEHGGRAPGVFPGLTGSLIPPSWSPDSAALAWAELDYVATWRFRDGASTKERLPFESSITSLAWSPDGRACAVAAQSRGIALVGMDTTAARDLRDPNAMTVGLAWATNGHLMACGESSVHYIDVGAVRQEMFEPGAGDFHPVGSARQVVFVSAAASAKRFVSLLDLPAYRSRRIADVGSGEVVRVSPDGRRVVVCRRTGHLDVFDVVNGQHWRATLPAGPIKRGERGEYSFAWARDGSAVAMAGPNGLVCSWEAGAGLRVLHDGFGEPMEWALAWSPGDRILAGTTKAGHLCVWRRDSGDSRTLSEGGATAVSLPRLEWSPDGRHLIRSAGGWSIVGPTPVSVDGWDVSTGTRLRIPPTTDIEWAHTAPRLALALEKSGSVALLDVTAGTLTTRIEGVTTSSGFGRDLLWSSDDRHLAIVGERISVWSAVTGRLSDLGSGEESMCDWTPDGSALIWIESDGKVCTWMAATGAVRILHHASVVDDEGPWFVIRSDGRWVAIADADTVVLCDIAAQTKHTWRVGFVVEDAMWLSDGTCLAVSSAGRIKVLPFPRDSRGLSSWLQRATDMTFEEALGR